MVMSVPRNSIFLSIDAVPEDAFVCDKKGGDRKVEYTGKSGFRYVFCKFSSRIFIMFRCFFLPVVCADANGSDPSEVSSA